MPAAVLRLFLTAALMALAVGCQSVTPARPSSPGRPQRTTGPSATTGTLPAPGQAGGSWAVPQRGQATRLTGLARLIANPGAPLLSDVGGGLLSNAGGALLSDLGGAVISNNSGTLVSNNGAGVVSSQGGRLAGKPAARLLLQAGAGLGVYGLAEAEIRLFDAAGRLLVDEAGKPLAATTGPDATFVLEAVLPPGNLVARIRLWDGGELTAIMARDGAQQAPLALTTASTLGTAYVLGLAQGDQARLDKLPPSEADRLVRELDVVRGFVQGAFRHDATTLDAITAGLRERVPAVDQVAKDVRALLLGQEDLGAGRPATEVPLGGPLNLAISREGRLLIGELLTGRIRELQPDGTLAMVLDRVHGRVRHNAFSLSGLAEGPDGTMFAVVKGANKVLRIPAAGSEVAVALGSGKEGRDAPKAPLQMACTPLSLAVGADGTLWVGERTSRAAGSSPRLLALRPGGQVEAFTPGDGNNLLSVAVGPDGAVYVLRKGSEVDSSILSRLDPGGSWTQLATGLATEGQGGLCLTPEGTLLVSEGRRGRVLALQPDGTLVPLPGLRPGPAIPGSLAAHPDGTVFIADLATNVVWAWRQGGPARPVAGTEAAFQLGETQAFAINTPLGLASDDRGGLYIAEAGSRTVKRFDGKGLAVVAGGGESLADGVPAREAWLNGLTGLAWHAGALHVILEDSGKIRRVDADGRIQTTHAHAELNDALGLAFGPDGQPWWAKPVDGWLARLTPTGDVQPAVGVRPPQGEKVQARIPGLFGAVPKEAAALRTALPTAVTRDADGHMVFCDTVAGRVYRVRSTNPATVELVAGLPLLEAIGRATDLQSGPGLAAENGLQARDAVLSFPLGLAFDAAGNLYVAEGGDRNVEALAPVLGGNVGLDGLVLVGVPPRIRRITPAGVITTIAGPGGRHFTDPEGGDALAMPTGLLVMPDGRLVIADAGSNLVRILPAGSY
jgi:sugar lactone lactonase YvrE